MNDGAGVGGFVQKLKDRLDLFQNRQRNRPFLEACMGACALVCMAEGRVSLSQRVHVDQVLETLTELKVFDPHEGVELFRSYVDAILADPQDGRQKIFDIVLREAADAQSANTIIRICLAVSEVNGQLPMAAQVEIVALANRLGVEPLDCGLYIDDTNHFNV
ncbi:MAG: hypothetical protein KZQ58_10015 [gamma proteobacterium symbiont of Bathyaustriella thionipta]|nr:hypothetical protein [gamma proteobacterium symbiont of Bathyaustriella thionipta]